MVDFIKNIPDAGVDRYGKNGAQSKEEKGGFGKAGEIRKEFNAANSAFQARLELGRAQEALKAQSIFEKKEDFAPEKVKPEWTTG
jgi:hypothetical protein